MGYDEQIDMMGFPMEPGFFPHACPGAVFPSQEKTSFSDAQKTVDEFICTVPWGKHRCVLVYRRQHAGQTWVRFRTWNLHNTKKVWYPSRRFFVIPLEHAERLIDALRAARDRLPSPKPAWLRTREEAEEEALDTMAELKMHPEAIEQARHRLEKKRRGRI